MGAIHIPAPGINGNSGSGDILSTPTSSLASSKTTSSWPAVSPLENATAVAVALLCRPSGWAWAIYLRPEVV
jgi:hypothetical protein